MFRSPRSEGRVLLHKEISSNHSTAVNVEGLLRAVLFLLVFVCIYQRERLV